MCLNACFQWLNSNNVIMGSGDPPKQEGHCEVGHSMGLLDNKCNWHIKKLATGHLQPECGHSSTLFVS